MADIVIFDGELPFEIPQGVKKFRRDEGEKILDFISGRIKSMKN
jgi:hypothetical protein